MCGIFGYIGKETPPAILLAGLQRLEYRGYDSWGICYQADSLSYLDRGIGASPESLTKVNFKQLKQPKQSDTLANTLTDTPADKSLPVSKKIKVNAGIAHLRWASHGGITEKNAHPHLAADGRFALAQNGIVENFQELKAELIAKGYKFLSETDTEVIVHLISEELKKTGSLLEATQLAYRKLTGRNTIILIDLQSKTPEIIALRNGSPLVVGKKGDSYFLGSDFLSFANHTNLISQLADGEGVYLTVEGIKRFKLMPDNQLRTSKPKFDKVVLDTTEITKGDYENFMLKEIHEQSATIMTAISYTEAELAPLVSTIKQARQVYIVGCGTAAFAAGQIAYYFRKLAKLNVIELKAYEMDSYKDLFGAEDLIIAISQSGETADTLEAVEFMQKSGGKVASLVNMVGSRLTQISDLAYLSRTGPEICVASTKAFTAQVSWGYLLVNSLIGKFNAAKTELKATSESVATLLQDKELHKQIQHVVEYLSKQEHAFILGRGLNQYIAQEGALKNKEITYKHFEGFTAGELKHGVIALIEKGTPVIGIVGADADRENMIIALEEVKARGAYIIGVGQVKGDLYDLKLNVNDTGFSSPIANVIPFQLLAYYLGKELGNNVDRPRNLAKSVTVK